MTYTLAQLLTPETQASVRARLIANLSAAGFPVSDWAPTGSGGIENALVDGIAGTIARYAGGLAASAARIGFLDYANGAELAFHAAHRMMLTKSLATRTRISVRLTSTTDAPPYNLVPGQLIFAGLTGNHYISVTGGLLAPGGTLYVQADAENAGSAYFEPDKTINSDASPSTFVTPLPGVTALNVPPTVWTTPKLAGNSAGTMTVVPGLLSNTSTLLGLPAPPIPFTSVLVRITADGDIGSGAFNYSIDNGVTWANGGPFQQTVQIAGGFLALSFRAAPGVSPSFLAGDGWSFQLATATLIQGNDDETDDALKARCRARWPSLADVPTESKIALWAQQASPRVGQVLADADPNVPGQVRVIVAGARGGVDSAAAADVQDFIVARLLGYKAVPRVSGQPIIGEQVVVIPATPRPISAIGKAFVPRDAVQEIQQAALAKWLSVLASVRIAGVVRLSDLEQIIMDAGAVAVENLALSGGTPNVQLAAQEIAVPPNDGTSIITSLGWAPV